jgi:hypothetical protein
MFRTVAINSAARQPVRDTRRIRLRTAGVGDPSEGSEKGVAAPVAWNWLSMAKQS